MASNSDDDKTMMAPGAGKNGDQDIGNALPIGTRLGEFELTGMVGEGGFGIVYLAYDHSLERSVALKEYMPSSLASRVGGTSEVRIKTQRHADTFKAGLRSFVNEAKVLAQFDHPALVKVYRFWEQNGTAYMVMPFYEGITLKDWLKQQPAPPDEATLKRLLGPVLEALEVIHRAQIYHRDIAPDNVLLLDGERPLLLDFGAARRVIGDMTQALTVILKPGYAPIEQYAEVPGMKQGAFTDIYALGALIYFAIMGRTPPPSVARMVNDSMQPLAVAAAGRYSDAFLRAVDRCLAVRQEDRPQSIREMWALLGISQDQFTQVLPDRKASEKSAAAPESRPAGGSRVPAAAVVGGVLALAVAGGIAAYLMIDKAPAPIEPIAKETVEAPPKPPVEAPPPPVVPPAVQTPVVPPAPPLPAVDTGPFEPRRALQALHDLRDPARTVSVAVSQERVRIGRDKPSFKLRSSVSGHLYVFMLGTDSKHLIVLFPNALDRNNRIEANRELTLPRPGWSFVAGGPAGVNQLVAMVSEAPRDFSGAGLQRGDPFDEFPLERLAELKLANQGRYDFIAGRTRCEGKPDCSDAFGASLFTIEEID